MRRFKVCLLGCRVAVVSVTVRGSGLSFVIGVFVGAMISVWYSSVRMGSLRTGETALVGQPTGGASLWGLRVLVFGWEMAVVFSAAVGGVVIVVRAQGGVLGADLRGVFVGEVRVLQGARDRSGVAAVGGGLTARLLDF